MRKFTAWLGGAVRHICDQLAHLQRLSIIGAGVVIYPTLIGFALVVWLGYARTPELQSQSLNFMGMALLSGMALWGAGCDRDPRHHQGLQRLRAWRRQHHHNRRRS